MVRTVSFISLKTYEFHTHLLNGKTIELIKSEWHSNDWQRLEVSVQLSTVNRKLKYLVALSESSEIKTSFCLRGGMG